MGVAVDLKCCSGSLNHNENGDLISHRDQLETIIDGPPNNAYAALGVLNYYRNQKLANHTKKKE
jgi:hypothetical protein